MTLTCPTPPHPTHQRTMNMTLTYPTPPHPSTYHEHDVNMPHPTPPLAETWGPEGIYIYIYVCIYIFFVCFMYTVLWRGVFPDDPSWAQPLLLMDQPTLLHWWAMGFVQTMIFPYLLNIYGKDHCLIVLLSISFLFDIGYQTMISRYWICSFWYLLIICCKLCTSSYGKSSFLLERQNITPKKNVSLPFSTGPMKVTHVLNSWSATVHWVPQTRSVLMARFTANNNLVPLTQWLPGLT